VARKETTVLCDVMSCNLVQLCMALYPRNKSQWWTRFSRTV